MRLILILSALSLADFPSMTCIGNEFPVKFYEPKKKLECDGVYDNTHPSKRYMRDLKKESLKTRATFKRYRGVK